MSDDQKLILTLDRFIPYCLNNLAQRISGLLSTIYSEEFGLTVPQWRVIAVLAEHKVLTAKAICQLTIMDKTKVSRAVKGLDDKGYLKQKLDDEDNRVRYLSLTRSGLGLYRRIAPKALDWESDLLASLDASEYRNLMYVVDKLNKRLDVLEKE